MADVRAPLLLVTSATELPSGTGVWGTGGWHPPREREALDWLTLARLCGWGVRVTRASGGDHRLDLAGASRWIVVACDPDTIGEDLGRWLAERVEAESLLVVARAGQADGLLARLAGAARRAERVTGQALRWCGPGPERYWKCRRPIDATALQPAAGTAVWATLDGAPLIVVRPVGRGAVATLGFHPSEIRDRDGAGTALLRHLLVWGARAPVAWHDLEGSLVLRMDDPGGAQNIHLRRWAYAKVDERGWAAVGAELARRHARLSIGYVAGWVDDGDAARGTLRLAGRRVPRVPGRVHPSPLVTYHDHTGLTAGTVHDYQAEYRGIQALRGRGLADVELHGYTHMHPEPAVWARAGDRFETASWYREVGRAADAVIAALPSHQRPLARGVAALRRYFGVLPTTAIFPGDDFTAAAVEQALGLGLCFVSSYYLALREGNRFCWTQHVCAPYLDQGDASWFDGGLPVVGYFHDRDLAVHGIRWLGECLDRWKDAGARRLLDLRELAGVVGRSLAYQTGPGGACLEATGSRAPALVRPHPVLVRWPEGPAPARVQAVLDGTELDLAVESLTAGLGRVVLPVQGF